MKIQSYSVLVRSKNELKEIGRIVLNEEDNICTLVNFNEEYEKEFQKSGYGEKVLTPKDGKEYIDSLIERFAFSTMIAIRKN